MLLGRSLSHAITTAPRYFRSQVPNVMGGWGSALGRYMRAFDSLWGQRHRPDVGYVLGYGDYGLGWSCRGGGRLKFRKLFEVPIPCFYPLSVTEAPNVQQLYRLFDSASLTSVNSVAHASCVGMLGLCFNVHESRPNHSCGRARARLASSDDRPDDYTLQPVSYTHLTLPTKA